MSYNSISLNFLLILFLSMKVTPLALIILLIALVVFSRGIMRHKQFAPELELYKGPCRRLPEGERCTNDTVFSTFDEIDYNRYDDYWQLDGGYCITLPEYRQLYESSDIPLNPYTRQPIQCNDDEESRAKRFMKVFKRHVRQGDRNVRVVVKNGIPSHTGPPGGPGVVSDATFMIQSAFNRVAPRVDMFNTTFAWNIDTGAIIFSPDLSRYADDDSVMYLQYHHHDGEGMADSWNSWIVLRGR